MEKNIACHGSAKLRLYLVKPDLIKAWLGLDLTKLRLCTVGLDYVKSQAKLS